MRSSQCPGLYLEYCLWLFTSQAKTYTQCTPRKSRFRNIRRPKILADRSVNQLGKPRCSNFAVT